MQRQLRIEFQTDPLTRVTIESLELEISVRLLELIKIFIRNVWEDYGQQIPQELWYKTTAKLQENLYVKQFVK